MPTTDDLEPGLVLQCRAHPTMTARDGGQRGDAIEFAQPGGDVEDILAGGGDATAELAEEDLLTDDHRTLRVEDEGFLLLQLRRDVALAIDQRLLAHVLGGDRLTVGMTDLDVIAEHLVEANLERADAAALALLLLKRTDPFACGARAVSNSVELGVEPGSKDAPILKGRRHLVNQRRSQGGLQLIQGRGRWRRRQLRPAAGEAADAGDGAKGL